MNELAVNAVLRSAESNQLYRVLWSSPERSEVYIFNMETLEMPLLVPYPELLRQIGVGIFTYSETDPFFALAREDDLTDAEKSVRDSVLVIIGEAVTDERKRQIKRHIDKTEERRYN